MLQHGPERVSDRGTRTGTLQAREGEENTAERGSARTVLSGRTACQSRVLVMRPPRKQLIASLITEGWATRSGCHETILREVW